MDTLCKKLLWIAMAVALGHGVTAQERVSKKLERSYTMTDSGELHLENKYGNINLFGWDKNEVSIVIDIEVNHRKRENAEELLKRIKPIIRDNDDYVSITYEIAEKEGGFFANLFEKANPFDFDRSNIQVDYTVYMPVKAELELTNTFGDVIIEDWKGPLKGKVEHGDLWINDDLNKADIDMKYGKIRAKSIDYGKLTLKNGDLDMENSKNLRINSNGTEISLNTITSLEFDSNKDEVTIKEVGTIYGNLKFTTLKLDRLLTSVDMTMRVADFRVTKILDPKTDIAIAQESSEISFNITGFQHRFEATIEEGLVRLPKSFDNVDSKMLDKGRKLREIKASYGNNPQGKITITGQKGIVLLKEL
ncbi:hypothetical protein ACEZ3G_09890 [Maribacter algicola]|uniref:Uncharacterized protein n=1 Tax=Meishania litoralis TaxID=3434685 RepID=A0ACC7LJ86_9FLAO